MREKIIEAMAEAIEATVNEGLDSEQDAVLRSTCYEAAESALSAIEQIVIDVMDECSDRMHQLFEAGNEEQAEGYRLRHEGAARVAQKLGMFEKITEK